MVQTVYFDNAATTPVRPEVFEEMTPYFTELYGNPSGIYKIAAESRNAVDLAREKIAAAIGAEADEIYFTAGGTEADNLAVQGIAAARAGKGGHIITTAMEHHALLHTCEHLEKNGFAVTYVKPDEGGFINPSDIEAAIKPDTVLISVMFANNEIGTIQPIEEIGRLAKKHGVPLHTDAVQAISHVPIDVKKMNIDMLSISAHKIYGPKGVGALYIRSGVKIEPMIYGGAQERNKRAGTHNVPGIVGLGKAIELVRADMPAENIKLNKLRNRLVSGIIERIPYVHVNGSMENRLPGNANLSFSFVESESILHMLDRKGICASSGSACNSESLEASHVLISIGLTHETANGAVRFSIGRYNTDADVDYVLETLPPVIEELRAMSPLYDDFLITK